MSWSRGEGEALSEVDPLVASRSASVVWRADLDDRDNRGQDGVEASNSAPEETSLAGMAPDATFANINIQNSVFIPSARQSTV